MSKNKNNKPVWSTRIKKKSSNLFAKVGSSIDIDKRLYKQDIKASTAHVEMLFKKKIITLQVKNKIIWGLKKILNEISTTAGYEFNKKNTVLATSGNNKFKFDIKQQGFAWMTSNKKEKIMVKIMKKGSRIMITGYNEKGSQTIDHYSLLGFTKAYNTAKKACS